ncbi:amidohydrolase family protein [Aureimonas psammosilenae]|uniref:amidohydrolase family protein n=1 Tax=Aureimonas psammosilenae TaxID=2495496 RepID=UPI001260D9B9|nr:amidohydrolase [Aureimonas psammosilenae]
MTIIDTHLHLVYPERFSYPWLEDAPKLNRPYRLEDYLAEASPLGIEAMLHMEVDVAPRDRERETDFALSHGAPVIGALAACRPEEEGFAIEAERLAAKPGVKGLRRILHQSPDALSQTPRFAENLRRLVPLGLSFDLCLLARQLHLGVDLADACPNVSFVLDHCGVPDIAGEALDPWREGISALAERANVCVKLSGIVAYAKPDWTVEDLRPFADHVIAEFGFDRIVWGSDAPVCTLTASLTRWVEATHALLDDCSMDEKAAVLSGNARRIYRL